MTSGEAVPLLAGLLSIPTGDRYPALDLTPQKRKEKTLRALVAQVEGLAARQPVLLVVEDAHWADPTSLELFELIVEPGVEPAAPGDRHLPAGIRTTLGRPSAGDADQSQSPAAPAPRRDDRARHRRQGLAPGDRRPDHTLAFRRRPSVSVSIARTFSEGLISATALLLS